MLSVVIYFIISNDCRSDVRHIPVVSRFSLVMKSVSHDEHVTVEQERR